MSVCEASPGSPGPPAGSEFYLTPDEVAAELRVTGDAVRKWITQGVTARGKGRPVYLAAFRVGGLWRIRRDSLRGFLAELNGGPVGLVADERAEGRLDEAAAARMRPRRRKGKTAP